MRMKRVGKKMTRRIQYKIGQQHAGKCIDVFLKEKDYSRAVLIELKKTKTGIQKNGSWAKVNEVLNTGDLLEICLTEQQISENIVPDKVPLDILYEDEDLLVVNKPYNMPIHPSVNHYRQTLANGIAYYYQQQNRPFVFRCMNRLDRDTTGVTILAKNLISASILSKRMKQGELGKTYIAFVEGSTQEKGTINHPIGREEGTIIKRKIDEVQGKHAVTHYQKLEEFVVGGKVISVVALQLETGRTHQIRVHMASIGHPLLGDFLYNEKNQMLTRQALHVVSCSFHHPITGEYMKLTAPLPEDMTVLIREKDN